MHDSGRVERLTITWQQSAANSHVVPNEPLQALEAARRSTLCNLANPRLAELKTEPSPGADTLASAHGVLSNVWEAGGMQAGALAAACNCSAEDMRLVLRAWHTFTGDLPTSPACHPLSSGSQMTAGWQNGSLWLHPQSNLKVTQLDIEGM